MGWGCSMRAILITMLVAAVLAVGQAQPAGAQTRADANRTESRSPAITIDLATVGGGLLGLVVVTGAVNLAYAGSYLYQGVPFAEALEVGTGMPVMASVLAVVLGGMFARDIVANEILPFFTPGESGKPAH